MHALIELLFDHLDNQLVAMRAGVVEPAVRLARSEDRELNHAAATLLCTLVLSEAEGGAAHALTLTLTLTLTLILTQTLTLILTLALALART